MVIHGIEFDASETEGSLRAAANNIITTQLNLKPVTIDKVYRISTTSEPGPVITKLIFECEKDLILSVCNKLHGTNISISEDLTKQARVRNSVFRNAIKEAVRNNLHIDAYNSSTHSTK